MFTYAQPPQEMFESRLSSANNLVFSFEFQEFCLTRMLTGESAADQIELRCQELKDDGIRWMGRAIHIENILSKHKDKFCNLFDAYHVCQSCVQSYKRSSIKITTQEMDAWYGFFCRKLQHHNDGKNEVRPEMTVFELMTSGAGQEGPINLTQMAVLP